MASTSLNWKKNKLTKAAVLAAHASVGGAVTQYKTVDFNFFRDHKASPNTALLPDSKGARGRHDQLLLDHRQYAGGTLPSDLTAQEVKFIKMHHTTRSRAEIGLKSVEMGYLKHTFNMSAYQANTAVSEHTRMWQYLLEDPWGTKQRHKEDLTCWQSKKVTTHYKNKQGEARTRQDSVQVPSRFYKDYKALQDKYYTYLRAGVPLYMDKQAEEYLQEALKAKERKQNPPLDGSNKLDRAKRIPYQWIKNCILRDICVITIGSFHFTPLMTGHRRPNETLHAWCTQLEQIQRGITSFKHGWDKIGSTDAVHKLWDWLGNDEKKVIFDAYQQPPLLAKGCNSYKHIKNTETLDELIAAIRGIEHTRFKGTGFQPKWCPEGKAKLLHTAKSIQHLNTQLAESKREVAQLSSAYREIAIATRPQAAAATKANSKRKQKQKQI
jgi:hypothetical protein